MTGSFFHNPSSEKEEIRGPYGECGQKSIIESDHNDRLIILMHRYKLILYYSNVLHWVKVFGIFSLTSLIYIKKKKMHSSFNFFKKLL